MTTHAERRIEVALEHACHLGEGPVWDERRGRLFYVDITRRLVHCFDPERGRRRSYDVGSEVGALATRRRDGLVLAVREGFATLDLESGRVAPLHRIDGPATSRMNDGKCDAAGRFWAGTLCDDGTSGCSALYRLDPEGGAVCVLDGVSVSNGLGWSGDGRTMYYIDSAAGGVDAFDFDGATGELGARRRLIDVPARLGLPDGMTVDADGFLWVALFGGGAVHRYRPDGALDRVLELPVSLVTSCTFGGDDLGDLYITSASHRLERPEPLAGALFRCRPGPRGLAAARYGG